jgi:acetyl esterase
LPLDPQIETLLAKFRDLRGKPVEEMTPREARFAGWVWKSLIGAPEAVASVAHHFIPGPTADLPARIYRPAEAGDGIAPALIYFHGGGFVLGNIEICDSFCCALANRTGCVVISVNYQKAPEHRYPIPFDDCFAATQWVFNWAQHLQLDLARIGLAGDSAGANLAVAVAMKARDAGGPQIAWQLLAYPSLRCEWDSSSAREFAQGYTLERAGVEYFWNLYVCGPGDADDPYCVPLKAASHAGMPPTLIVCAEYDPLLDDGRDYAAALEAAGVPVTLLICEGMSHGFLWMGGVVDRVSEVLDDIGAAARRALKPAGSAEQ